MTIKNLPSIGLHELSMSDSNAVVIKESLTLKTTGVAAMSGCTTADTQVHTAANLLQTYETGANLNPPLYTTAQVNAQKKITILLYNKVIRFMKGAANDLAIQTGDVNTGINMAEGCGATLSKKTTPTVTDFGVIEFGPNWIKVHAKKAVSGYEGHIFRCGLVPAKGTPPAKGAWVDFYTLSCTIEISDLASGTVLAINHSGILPVGHTKTPPVVTPVKMKKATKLPASKAKHPVFSFTSPDPYTWDGWIFVVIQ